MFSVYCEYIGVYPAWLTANLLRRMSEGTGWLSSVKGKSDFALGCRLRCIINRVICASPPSALVFSPRFFLILRRLPLERGQVEGCSPLLLSGALGFIHQKKSSRSHQSHLVPLQSPKLLQLPVRNCSSANPPISSLTSSFRLHLAASRLTTPTPSLLTVCHGRLDDGN